MGMTFFARHSCLRKKIPDYFIKHNLNSFCAVACSYGADVYDFIFELLERGAYRDNLIIHGTDINHNIMDNIQSRPYKCSIRTTEMKNIFLEGSWKEGSLYPYPIILPNLPDSYKKYFNEELVLDEKIQKLAHFYCQNIKLPATQKYDLVVAFTVFSHLYKNKRFPYLGKKDKNDIFNVIDNLLEQTNNMLVISAGLIKDREIGIDSVFHVLMEYLNNKNLNYDIFGGTIYIFKDGIPKGI